MSTLLAVDPSLTCTGLAFFRGRILVAVGRVKGTQLPILGNANHIAWLAAEMARGWSHAGCEVTELATEWPVVRTMKTANALFGMPAIAGALSAYLDPEEIGFYKPKDWCGEIPKSTAHSKRFASARGKAIASKLSDDELEVFHRAQTHDEVDAVGIGLHHLGRGIKRRR